MVFYVYALACMKEGNFRCFYVGQTNDLWTRLDEHIENVIEGLTKHFTGRFDFVRLAWSMQVPTRQDALRLERYLKSLNPNAKRRYMKQNGRYH